MDRKSIQWRYGLLQGFYWGLFGLTIAFVNSYLTGIGLGVEYVGAITAIFTLLAGIMQSFLGHLSDRSTKFNWKNLIAILLVIRIIVNLLLMINSNLFIAGILYGLAILLVHAMMPFVNAANFYYEEKNIELNYGMARGVGSLFYAALTYIVGNWIASFGVHVVLTSSLLIGVLFFMTLLSMPYNKEDDLVVEVAPDDTLKQGFFKKYPKFILMITAFALIMAFHNNTTIYMLQILETVKAGNKELGTALSIAAMCELPMMFGFSALKKRMATGNIILFSSVAYFIKGLIYIFASSVMGIYIAQVLQMLSFASFASAAVYYTQERMDIKDKIQGQSIMSSFQTFGSVLGSLIGGFVIKSKGIIFNVWLMVILIFISFVLILISREDRKKV